MHRGLDIAISDEASSTVIHVRGPVSARMCDVGGVFDKLGIDVISCSTLPSASSCDMTLVVVDRYDSQPLDDALKQSVSEGLQRVFKAHSQHGSPSSQTSSSTQSGAGPGGLSQQLQAASGSRLPTDAQGTDSSSGRATALEACRADSASESIPVSKASSAQLGSMDAPVSEQRPSRQESWQEVAGISLPPLPLASLLHPPSGSGQAVALDSSSFAPAGGLQQQRQQLQPSVRFSLDNTEIPFTEPGAASLQRTSSGRPPKPALKIDIPSDSDSSRWNNDSSNPSNPSSRQAGQEPGSSGAVSISVPVQRPQQHEGVLAQDLQQRLMLLGMNRRNANDTGDLSSDDDDDAHRSVSCRSGGSASSGSATAGAVKWQRANSRSCGDLLLLANKQQQHMQRVSDTGPDAQVENDCFGTHRSSMDAGLDGQGDSSRSLGSVRSVDRDQQAVARRLVPMSPAAAMAGSSSAKRPPPRTPSRILLSPSGPDGSGEGKLVFIAIPKKESSGDGRSKRGAGSSGSQSVAATPRVSHAPASGNALRTPASARVDGARTLKQLSSSIVGNKPRRISSSFEQAAAAADEAVKHMAPNVAQAARELLNQTHSYEAAAAAAAVASEKGDSSTPLPSPLHVSRAAAAAEQRFSDEGGSPLSPRVPRTSPCSFHEPPPTPVHPAVRAAAADAFLISQSVKAHSAVAHAHSMELQAAANEEILQLPACTSPQRSPYRLSGSPGLAELAMVASPEAEAGVSATIPEGCEGDAQASVDQDSGDMQDSEAGTSSSEEWWCGEVSGLTVRDVMTGPVKIVSADTDVLQARQLMMQHNMPGMLVDAGPGQPVGLLTRTDFFKASSMLRRKGSRKRPHKPCVRDIMSSVLVVEADMSIERCAQALQEAGTQRAAVRDAAAAEAATAPAVEGDSSQDGSDIVSPDMAAYVGLVSDAIIFRCLGLSAAPEGQEELLEDGLLHLPDALRLHSGLDRSFDSSAGTETPLSSRSRVGTPLLDSTCDGGGHNHRYEQQERQQSASTDAGPSEQQSRQTSLVKLPDIVMLREGLAGQGSSAASSTGSGRSGITAAADGRKSVAGGISDDGATRYGSFALAAAASDGSNAALLDVQGAGSGGPEGLPDALERYKHAAALWEVDMDDIEMIKRIGEGSFGEVMLATYRGTKVAVKRLRVLDLDDVKAPNEQYAEGGSGDSMRSSSGQDSQRAMGASQAAFRQFFEREIAILASIRHPNVVNFIGACHKPGQRCLVTEYCARGSLDQVLHKSGLTLDLSKRIEFALDIARGMACLHAQRPIIIHRDLKTANLLVSARFEIKVADFGLSRIKDASHLQVSRAGLEGTIEYCAPEVLRGEPYTERCDVYSFGVVLWELLLRQRPYSDAEVPVFLLMVNIGNGTLTLPEVPVEAATPGLVDLVNRCLSFSASDRPDFREVLATLEGEYRALRARQPPRSQRDHQQQQSLPQHQLQHAAAVPRCDSASSLAVNQQPPLLMADSPDPGSTPYNQSPAGTLGATAYVPPALTPSGSFVLSRPGTAGPGDPEGYGVVQQLWPPSQQQQQQQPQQRHRLSQHDSGLQTASSGGSAAPSFGFGVQPTMQQTPAGTPQIVQQYSMQLTQQQQQLYSVPLPQLQPQQLFVASACNSPRQQQPQQFAVPVQQPQQYVMPHVRVMSAFPSGSIGLQQSQQQQQYQHGYQQQGHGAGLNAPGGGSGGGSSVKPPRHKQQLSRARSMPMPQSVNWELEGLEAETEEQVFENIQEETGGQDVLLFAEDSFGGVSNCSMTGYSPCPSGQLCMLVEPASSTYASSSAAGMMPYQQPQQQVLVTPNGQQVAVQQVPMQPVLIQQPGGQLQQAYIQQQPAFATLTQAPQPQQQQQPQQAARMIHRAMGIPSPTPAVLGRSGTPLSSSPSPGLNPLVVMAAAGAHRQREGSASGATSPRYTSSSFVTGAGHGHHSHSSSHGCSQEMPPLHLLQLSDMHMGSRPSSPQRTPVRSERMSSEGGSTPAGPSAYGYSSFSNGPPQAPQGQQSLAPGTVVVNTAGPAMVTPLLLQRLDSLHRSGSSGCSPRCLQRSGSPGLQSGEQSGQLMGLLVPGYCSGPASGPNSPRSHSPRHERHVQPAVVAAVHHLHRPGSSRLAIQGSYELPPGAAAAAAAGSGGIGDALQAAGSSTAAAMPPAGSAGSAGFTDSGQPLPVYGVSVVHAPPAHLYHHQFPQAHPTVLQPSSRRAPSLLRIDSNSRDRAISPFAVASGASGGLGSDHGSYAGSMGPGVGSGAGVHLAAAPAGTCSRTLSPFAAAFSMGSSLEDVASRGHSNDIVPEVNAPAAPAATVAAGAERAAAGRPPAPARYVSPFAAAAGRQEDDGDTDAVFDTSAERSSRSASPVPGTTAAKQPNSPTKAAPALAVPDAGSGLAVVNSAAASGNLSGTRIASPFALMQQQEKASQQ